MSISSKSCFKRFSTFLLVGLLFFCFAKDSNSASCFPTCSSVDARFLLIVEGAGFQTLTTETLNIRLTVPANATDFTLGIFDGDSNPLLGNWDTGAPFLISYTLRADPDMDNSGQPVFNVESTALQNNGWVDFTLPTNASAMDENGNFVYTLVIVAEEPLDPIFPFVVSNAFKLRSSGLIEIDEIFTFTSAAQATVPVSPSDFEIIYPNYNPNDGVGPEDLVGENYDGSFSFFFDIEEQSTELEFWDGDADRGNFDGTQTDTDDPNTGNIIPSFAPLDTDVVPQGVNPPSPFDDADPTLSDFNFLIVKPGAVSYLTIFPDGQVFDNTNPSGNREWELWLISTLTDNPLIADRMAPVIPAGEYEIQFQGLDINNFVSLRPLQAVRGEVIPDDDTPTAVPTMSEWGLIALAIVFGVVGILYARRYKKVFD